RILADHGRAMTFLMADGVLPGNEGRGYVLKRMIRRAVRHARLLGLERDITGPLVDATVETMGDAYPELVRQHDFVRQVAEREEARFGETLRRGLDLLAAAGPSDFTGYREAVSTGRILALLDGTAPVPRAEAGRRVDVILDRTPFYAESGGQVGDVGTIETADGTLRVTDTVYAVPGN